MKKRIGRPPYEPTELDKKRVRIMAAAGIGSRKMAEALGVGVNTLYKHYKKDIQTAAVDLNSQVVANLFNQTKDSAAAAIFWCKTRLGWREHNQESEGDSGSTVINLHIGAKPNDTSIADESDSKAGS